MGFQICHILEGKNSRENVIEVQDIVKCIGRERMVLLIKFQNTAAEITDIQISSFGENKRKYFVMWWVITSQ